MLHAFLKSIIDLDVRQGKKGKGYFDRSLKSVAALLKRPGFRRIREVCLWMKIS